MDTDFPLKNSPRLNEMSPHIITSSSPKSPKTPTDFRHFSTLEFSRPPFQPSPFPAAPRSLAWPPQLVVLGSNSWLEPVMRKTTSFEEIDGTECGEHC